MCAPSTTRYGDASAPLEFHGFIAISDLVPREQWARQWQEGQFIECLACKALSTSPEDLYSHLVECKALQRVSCPSCHQLLSPEECTEHQGVCAAVQLHQVGDLCNLPPF